MIWPAGLSMGGADPELDVAGHLVVVRQDAGYLRVPLGRRLEISDDVGGGNPGEPAAGRGGGWRLLGGARTDLSGLGSAEARALFPFVGPAASVDQQRERAAAMVIVDPVIVPYLRTHFGERSVNEATELTNARIDDHRVRLRVTAPTELMLARGLAGWGQQVDVLEPESVRVELRRIGTELVQRNG